MRDLAIALGYKSCLFVPLLMTVVDEAALRRQVGTRKVMCDQLLHLARIATEHPMERSFDR